MTAIQKKLSLVLAAYVAVLVTALSLLPVLQNGFTNWDDSLYITNNPSIRNFRPGDIWTIFTSLHYNIYKPIIIFSYALEYHLFGLNPIAFHATNLIFHLLNVLLVFWMIYLISGKKTWVSFITALLFGIHPLHVESVAWITERKDVLYSFFFFLSIICYLYYSNKSQTKFYFLAILLFVLSLMCKPMGAALPILLILLDWFLNREFSEKKWIRNKIPFLMIMTVFSLMAANGQYQAVVESHHKEGFAPYHFFYAAYATLFYLAKMLWPFKLSCIYPLPDKTSGYPPFIFLISPSIFIFMMALVIYFGRFSKKILFGVLFFCLNLFPVLMLIPYIPSITFDRYTYVPLIGLFYLAGEGVQRFYDRRAKHFPVLKASLFIFLTLLTAGLCFLSFERSKVWKDSVTLWSDAIKNYPRIPMAYLNRGQDYAMRNDSKKAMADFNQALQIKPDFAEAYHNRGAIYHYEGKLAQAVAEYSRSVKIDAYFSESLNNRGLAYSGLGEFDKALADFNASIKAKPEAPDGYNNRGNEYSRRGEHDKAIADFNQALKLSHGYYEFYLNRGNAFARKGDFPAAMVDFKRALALKPDFRDAEYNIRRAAQLVGGKEILLFSDKIQQHPGDWALYFQRASLYEQRHEYDQALTDYDKIISLDPKQSQPYWNMAVIFEQTNEQYNAMSAYQKFLEHVAPSDPRAAFAKERIKRLKAGFVIY